MTEHTLIGRESDMHVNHRWSIRAVWLAVLVTASILVSAGPSQAKTICIDPECVERVEAARDRLTDGQYEASISRCEKFTLRVNQGRTSTGIYRCVVLFGDEYETCVTRVQELRQRSTARQSGERKLYRECVDLAASSVERSTTTNAAIQDRCNARARRVHRGVEPSSVFGCVPRFGGERYGECVEERTERWQAARIVRQQAAEAQARSIQRMNEARFADAQRRSRERRIAQEVRNAQNTTGGSCRASGVGFVVISCY